MREETLPARLTIALLGILALVCVGGAADAQKRRGGGGGSGKPDLDPCGCPTSMGAPSNEIRTFWTIDSTTTTTELLNPVNSPFAFDVTVTEGPTRTILTGTGKLVVINSGTKLVTLSSVSMNLETVYTGSGSGTAPGPGGQNWDLVQTGLENESDQCVGLARTCYGDLLQSPGASIILFDPNTDDVIALSGNAVVAPTVDNDGDGLRDEDPALPSDPSLITGGCAVIDNDGDGAYDEDPIDGIDNDGDGLIDEDDPDDDGDGLVDEDGAAEDAVIINFAYEFDITGLGLVGPGDGVVPSTDDQRLDLVATFYIAGRKGGACSIDIDCDGVAEANVLTVHQRRRFDPVAATPLGQTVTLADPGAVSLDPSCASVTTNALGETVSATGVEGTVTSRAITGTVSCAGGACTTNVVSTTTLASATPSLVTGSPASAGFSVECTPSPPTTTEPGDFWTQPQVHWGLWPEGSNVGVLLHENFAALFPNGLIVGDPDGPDSDGERAIHLRTALAVTEYLPATGTPAALVNDQTDPLVTSSGSLGGNLVAATLNMAFDAAGIRASGSPVFPPGALSELVFMDGYVAGPLVGRSVGDVVQMASAALSGQGTPAGVTFTDLDDALRTLNENYAGGDADYGGLDLPPMVLAVDAGAGNQLMQFFLRDTLPETAPLRRFPLLPAGGTALDVAVSADGRRALVSDFGSQQVHLMDVETTPALLGSISVPLNSIDVDLAYAPDGGFALVTDGASTNDGQIISLDLVNFGIKDILVLPSGMHAQAIEVLHDPTSSSGYAAVAIDYYNSLIHCVKINAGGTLTFCGSQPSGGTSPLNVTADAELKTFLVGHFVAPSGVAQFEIDGSGAINLLATYPGTSFSPSIGVAQSMAFSRDGSYVYWYDTTNHTVRKLSIGAGKALTDTGVVLPAGAGTNYFGVDQIAIDRTGVNLVVNGSDGFIHALDVATDQVIGTIQTDNFAGGGIVFQR